MLVSGMRDPTAPAQADIRPSPWSRLMTVVGKDSPSVYRNVS